jgi:hypothetical protein
MKRILLCLTLGAALACPSLAKADDSNPGAPPPPDGSGFHHGKGVLTDAERQEFKAAYESAIATNPTLGTEGKALWAQMKAAHDAGQPPSDDLKAQMKAYHEQLDAALLVADKNIGPILEKLKKAHHHHDDGAGAPPPPPPGQ